MKPDFFRTDFSRIMRSSVFFLVMISIFLTSCGKTVVVTDTSFETENYTIEEIWEIKDEYDFVYEMDMYLATKSEYGDDISELNKNQKTVCYANSYIGIRNCS